MLTSSPNVGEAPQAISESSAEIMIDVFEQPMLVICHPKIFQYKHGLKKKAHAFMFEFLFDRLTSQILHGLRVHVCLARLLVLTEHEEPTNVSDGQTIAGPAEGAAHATGTRVKVLDHARHHLVLWLRVAEPSETAETPCVGAFLRIDRNLFGHNTINNNTIKKILFLFWRDNCAYTMIVAATEVNDLHTLDGSYVAILCLFDEQHDALGRSLKVE